MDNPNNNHPQSNSRVVSFCITQIKSKGVLKSKKIRANIINPKSKGEMALLVPSMATQKPLAFATKSFGYKKAATIRSAKSSRSTTTSNIKLLTNVEKLRLLTKAEKAGLLSAAEKAGFSLSSIEKLGLLSKAEELGVLSAATDPSTPSALLTLSLALLALGPFFVFLVPEQYTWEIGLQVVVALVSVVGGSAAFAASNFVSNLQKSS